LAARQCPNCMAILPVTKVASRSNALVCAGCGKPLEISAFSRYLAAFIGLAVGALVWRLTTAHYADHPGALGWVLPILFAYLALSVIQSIALMVTADLRLKDLIEPPPAVESHSTHTAHGSSLHASH
jgi:hypothetical protein